MGTVGNMEQFYPGAHKFDEWVERLEFYFDVNDIKDNKKASWLLTLVGGEVYSVLKSLINPEKPSSKTYEEIVRILLKHYEPENNVIAERYKFNTRIQYEYESISDYVIVLRNLASTCNYGTFLDDALRDRFVCGILNPTIQCTLLQKIELTFETACHTAQAIEMTEAQMKFLKPELQNLKVQNDVHEDHDDDDQHHQTDDQQHQTDEKKKNKPNCHRCGRRQHNPNFCPAKEWTCYTCKEVGHTSLVCPKKNNKTTDNCSNYSTGS